jgi:tyrosyl-tRNA synthetase
VVLTMPLLRGTDGVQKMSKSLDNGIYLDEPPEAQFGKLMRIPDSVLEEYLRLTTDLDPAEVDRLAKQAAAGGSAARDVKRRLAREVVTLYHGPEAAAAAEAAFDAGVRQRAGTGGDASSATPLPIPSSAVRDGQVWIVALLADAGLVSSRGEARRLVSQGAVRFDGQPVGSIDQTWPVEELDGRLLTVGRRAPVRLQAPQGS